MIKKAIGGLKLVSEDWGTKQLVFDWTLEKKTSALLNEILLGMVRHLSKRDKIKYKVFHWIKNRKKKGAIWTQHFQSLW